MNLDIIQNYGYNPYKFDTGEDHSHEYPPLDLCYNLPIWDIRVPGPDDHQFDYSDTNPVPYIVENIDGGNTADHNIYIKKYDFNLLGNYNIPEKYANVYAKTILCLTRTLEDHGIAKTGDIGAKGKIFRCLEPAADAYIDVHVGINPRMRKVYVEFEQNKRMRAVFDSNNIDVDSHRLDEYLVCALNNYFGMTDHMDMFKIEVIRPKDLQTFCCDVNSIASDHTVYFWRSMYGGFYFLEDREEVKLDMRKKGIGYNRKIFYDKVHQLNRDFNMTPDGMNNHRIPEVFNEYLQLYEEEFGYHLPDFHEGRIRIALRYNMYI